MEESPELGEGHNTTFYRELDARIGRWWSVDPEAQRYYSWSPYNLSADNPIANSDPSGATFVPAGKTTEENDRISAGLKKFEENVPDLYYFLNNVRFGKIGSAPLMPGQKGYETATPLNISVVTADLDGIKAETESTMESANMRKDAHQNASTTCLGCLQGRGLSVEDNGVFVLTRAERIIKDRSGDIQILITRSLPERVKLTDLNVEQFDQYTPPIINPEVGFLIKIDDFVNDPSGSFSTMGSGAEAKRDGRTLAHEGGHIKAALRHYVNYIFKSVAHPEAGGHAAGDKGGEYAHEAEEEYDSNLNKKK